MAVQQKNITLMFVLLVAGVLVIGTFVLLAIGIVRPSMALLQQKELEIPIHYKEVEPITTSAPPSVAKQTPPPAQAQVSYPPHAVNLLVNNAPVFSVSGRDVAERVLEEYLSFSAFENLSETEHLIRAYIDADLSICPADGSVEYLSYEAAKEKLLASRALVPVFRSVEKAEITVGTVPVKKTRQAQLPRGTRLYRSLGKPERLFGLTEIVYKNGIAVSSSQTVPQTRVGSDPVPRTIEEGTYNYTEGGRNPSGKKPGELQFISPCEGSILSGFGMRNGSMHYGIDFSLRAGDNIIAPESGTVIFIGERGDYGLVIEIRHGDGFVSRLTHCSNPSVELEQHVYRGDPIAILAKQENDPQPHLHYELLIDGIPFDPLQYIAED